MPVDTRNTPITSGCTVAYNISGQVALGQVKRIVSTTRYGRPRWEFEVVLQHRAAGCAAGHFSRVTNPCNLLVLASAELPA